jgi:ATP-dependent DNA helicase RecQ
MTTEVTFLNILQSRFGFNTFRPGQLEAIRALMEQQRLLCIQPTGHGKSLLYQLPSCLLPGITLVISPLLALMRDQIEHLNGRFHIPAASINSDQSDEENQEARQLAASGKIQVLFISPEQLDHVDRFDFLLHLQLALIVVDEAHCISTWGHDFRPSYRQILHFIAAAEKTKPAIKILGLTATADKRVESDIVRQLSSSLQKIEVQRENMDRPNIGLSVCHARGPAEKLALCQHFLNELEGSGLIYCATRENAELVADYLHKEGIKTVAYHAGLESEDKRSIQTAFSQDHYKVVVATTALGMGIDKGNLRFVIHFDIPGSITAYYQEVGRCGRDGLKAQGILLYDKHDKKIQEYFIESALPSSDDFNNVIGVVGASESPPNLTTIKRLTGLHPTRVMIVVAELVEQGYLKKTSLKGSQVYLPQAQKAPLDLSRYTTQYTVKKEELEKILIYAEQRTDCRMAMLRQALGDVAPQPCGRCDACLKMIPPQLSPEMVHHAQKWLTHRPLVIAESKTVRLSQGVSLLDGKLRPPLFVRFMQNRAEADTIEEELLQLLKIQLSILHEKHLFTAVVVVPSSTWKSREFVASALSSHLGVPLLLDCLSWKQPPEKRQGELLNNDQRHFNVHGKMEMKGALPEGSILLLDDYIGSGATMKEAARAIREWSRSPLVPFTIAQVKWRLGKPGFV